MDKNAGSGSITPQAERVLQKVINVAEYRCIAAIRLSGPAGRGGWRNDPAGTPRDARRLDSPRLRFDCLLRKVDSGRDPGEMNASR